MTQPRTKTMTTRKRQRLEVARERVIMAGFTLRVAVSVMSGGAVVSSETLVGAIRDWDAAVAELRAAQGKGRGR